MFWLRPRPSHRSSHHPSRPSQARRSDDQPESSRRRRDNDDDDDANDDKHRDQRIEIILDDLDAEISGRQGAKIGIKKTHQLGHVAAFLRKRYDKGRQRIPADARIEFYSERVRLDGEAIPKALNALSYRVFREGDDDGTLRIDWNGSTGGLNNLAPSQRQQVEAEVLKEGTVGTIRGTIARVLRESQSNANANAKPANPVQVQDPLQIEICAVGGLRPGALQGSNWVARRATEAWLCRYIRIHVRAHGDYFVFKGFNEEYVWHRPELDHHRCAPARALKQWLRHEVLSVALLGSSSDKVQSQARTNKTKTKTKTTSKTTMTTTTTTKTQNDDIRLLLNQGQEKGKENLLLLHGDRARVRVGRTLEFEVPRTVGDRFVAGEAWLLQMTEMCSVCSDDKRVSEMPRKVTASCAHPATMCKECVAQWITSSLDTVAWDRLRCPECPQLLRFEDVGAFASPDVFERYDALATRAAMGAMAEFKWCLNPRCKAGQIFPRDCSKAQCYACKRSVCVHHNVPWHKHETCEQYDYRTRKLKKGEKASAKWIKETTKPCPRCDRAVHKYTGCDHVTCICGHEWCWLCLSPHYRDDQGLLQCKHKEDCRYFLHPPDYEGGRAFLPFLPFGGAGGGAPPFHRHAHPHPHPRQHPHPRPPPFGFPPAGGGPPPGGGINHHPIPRPRPPGGGNPFRLDQFVFLNEMLGQDAVNHHHNQGNFRGGGEPEREARPAGQFNFARAAADFGGTKPAFMSMAFSAIAAAASAFAETNRNSDGPSVKVGIVVPVRTKAPKCGGWMENGFVQSVDGDGNVLGEFPPSSEEEVELRAKFEETVERIAEAETFDVINEPPGVLEQ